MSDDTGNVKILADIAGEISEPAAAPRRVLRPAAPELAPSRDQFRRARRTRRWRFRAMAASVIIAVVLIAVGLVFVLAEPTSEIGPPVVAGESTIRETTTIPTTTTPPGPETTIRAAQPPVSVK